MGNLIKPEFSLLYKIWVTPEHHKSKLNLGDIFQHGNPTVSNTIKMCLLVSVMTCACTDEHDFPTVSSVCAKLSKVMMHSTLLFQTVLLTEHSNKKKICFLGTPIHVYIQTKNISAQLQQTLCTYFVSSSYKEIKLIRYKLCTELRKYLLLAQLAILRIVRLLEQFLELASSQYYQQRLQSGGPANRSGSQLPTSVQYYTMAVSDIIY